ncbi:hypothetical protein HC928_19695, partial [bacterium]|nr:hypothetical protein [bacterium]
GAGVKLAMFNITSDDPDTPVAAVELRGVVLPNFNGSNSEPSLQRILDALNIPVTVGDNDPTTTTIHSTPLIASGRAVRRGNFLAAVPPRRGEPGHGGGAGDVRRELQPSVPRRLVCGWVAECA